jgi:hypothetical protein
VLVLATCDTDSSNPLSTALYPEYPPELGFLFKRSTFKVCEYTEAERTAFFSEVVSDAGLETPDDVQRISELEKGVKTRLRSAKIRKRGSSFLPDKATLAQAASALSVTETESLERYEKATLRKLTMYLRNVLNTLERDRKFKEFVELPNEEELPEYYEEIAEPVSLETMHDANDDGKYGRVRGGSCVDQRTHSAITPPL